MIGAAAEGIAVAPGLFTMDPPALIGGECAACGAIRFPRRAVCPACQGGDIRDRRLSDTGTIYTFTIMRGRPPGYGGEIPYAFGVVELPEGLRVTSTITASDLESLRIGDTVRFNLITIADDAGPIVSYSFDQVGRS